MNRFVISILSLGLLVSCSGDENRQSYLPGNSGNQGELIVVAPLRFWKSNEVDILRKGLLSLVPDLPADEPMFEPVEVQKEGFNSVFKTHRNILEFRIDPSKQTSVLVRENVFAKQQLMIVVSLNSINDLVELVNTQLDQILWRFHEAELTRLQGRNRSLGNEGLNEKVLDITGIDLTMQPDFEIALEGENFLWLRLDREKPIGGYQHQINQGILIYHRPYVNTSAFSDSSLIVWKNAMGEQYVEGPKGSHMAISTRLILPAFNAITFHENTAKELRGLWRMEGMEGVFMGGPFYGISFYNPQNQHQYMVEGYVYGPQFNKRAFIREIEAIVKSARLIAD